MATPVCKHCDKLIYRIAEGVYAHTDTLMLRCRTVDKNAEPKVAPKKKARA